MKRKAIILAALMALVAVPASGQVIRVITPGGGGSTGACALCLESDGTGWPLTASTQITDTGDHATFGGDIVGNALKSIAGAASLAISATPPAATTGASQAGKAVTITASPAVASTDTAGAAAGGDVTIRGGNAARLTSGNAAGGEVRIITGASIGTATTPLRILSGTSSGSVIFIGNEANPTDFALAYFDVISWRLRSNGQYQWSSDGSRAQNAADTGLARSAAGVVMVTDGGAGIGKVLTSRLVEANTAGSGAPNILTATESFTVLTNEGTTAANYHTLPTAAAGHTFTFVVQDADGLRVTANTGDTIRVIDKVTAAAGYIESTTIGSVVTLVAINATEWIATPIRGVWTDGTFTYDDTGLTSP